MKTGLGVDFFVHPLPALAVAIMALNDHYLKYHFNNWWTGKLSDFAGLFFFPLFLCALYVLLVGAGSPGRRELSPGLLFTSMALTDLGFILVKLHPTAARLYEETLSLIGIPSRMTMDPSDLIAVSVNVLTFLYAKQFWRPYRGST